MDSPFKILEMERNWKGKLSECETRERIGKLSNYFREERKGLLSKIIGQMTMYEFLATVTVVKPKHKGN